MAIKTKKISWASSALCLGVLAILSIIGCGEEPVAPLRSGVAIPPSEIPVPSNLENGGTLRVGLASSPEHFDPHNSLDNTALNWVAGLVYSRLFKFRANENVGVEGEYILDRQVTCDLCESWQQVTEDTFEITLRSDAVWQDIPPLNGRSVTARDVVDSLERQSIATNVNASLLQNFEDFQVINNRTLSFRLTNPDAEVFEKLAHSGSSIIPVELYEDDNDEFDPADTAIGSGPFYLASVEGNYVLRANPNYYEIDSGGNRLPYIDVLEIHFTDSPVTRLDGVLLGFYDFAGINPEQIADVEADPSEFKVWSTIDTGNGVEITINTALQDLSPLEVRQALFLSWDIDGWISTIWGLSARPTSGLPLSSRALYDPNIFADTFNDTDAANRLLNSIAFNQTEPVTITVGDFGDNYIQLARMMVTDLASVGIQAQLEIVTTREFAEQVWLDGDFQVAVGAATPVFSLSDKLLSYHHSAGPLNTTSYGNQELDDLIIRQAGEYEIADRNQLLNDIEQLVADGLHRINATASVFYWVVSPCINNFIPNTQGSSNAFVAQIWLDTDICLQQ